jgi:tryptophan-rich sensory protein
MNAMNRLTKAWISLILLMGTLVINGLGAFGFFNGASQKVVSDRYLTLITPAPFTFSIWSVIYILLISAAIVMIIRHNDAVYGEAIDRISVLFWISSGLNMLWIVCFSYLQIGLSALIILAFAVVLSLIVKAIGKIAAGKRWLLPAAFGLYSGWLLIATVVNIAAFLVMVEWDGGGIAPEYWGIIILAVAVVLAVIVTITTKNFFIPLPIAWGYFGINQFLGAATGFQGQYPTLQAASLVGIVLLLGLAIFQFFFNRRQKQPEIERPD